MGTGTDKFVGFDIVKMGNSLLITLFLINFEVESSVEGRMEGWVYWTVFFLD